MRSPFSPYKPVVHGFSHPEEMMKRHLTVVLLLALLLMIGGCRGSRREQSYPTLSNNFTEASFERSAGRCDNPDSACARVTLHYLIFGEGLSAPVRDSLNAAMRERLFTAPEEGQEGGTPEAVAEGFLRSFQDTRNEMPEAMTGWSLERSATVAGDTFGLATIEFEEGIYTGGAHPNSHRAYRVFDLVSGRTLTLAELVKPGMQENLNAIAEQEFRDLQQLGAQDNLDSAGFWFPDNRFHISSNFCVSSSGLVIHFNQYEIAPYAFGPIELTIPFEKLGTILELRKEER
jgi:hypothetical protein